MEYSWLNVGSVLFGVIALAVPVAAMIKKVRRAKIGLCILISMGFCLMAVLFQMAYGNYRVEVQDWSALMDTAEAMLSLSAKLSLFTFLLNLAAFLAAGGEERKEKR